MPRLMPEKARTMKLKIDDNGAAVLQDGKPVYVDTDGKEFALDGAHLYGRVRDLTTEAAGHRKAKEAAEERLKVFGDIDPEAAKTALNTVANLDQKKLIDAGEVEKVRAEAIKATREQYAPVEARMKELETALHHEKIGGSFARSKFIADNISLPADIAETYFGRHFKLENGAIVATDQHGNQIYSRNRPGEPADFEEAMGILFDAYPHKDAITKGKVGSGGGAQNGGDVKTVNKTVKASALEAMTPTEKAAFFAKPENAGLQVVDA